MNDNPSAPQSSSGKIAMIIVVVLLIAGGVYYAFRSSKTAAPPQSEVMIGEGTPEATMVKFGNAKKAAHYESNTPAHGEVLAAAPINVVINFNFDLAAPSSISIQHDGTEYGQGETEIDTNQLSMRRALNTAAPDGLYRVTYKACWPDQSCHDGNFEFAIDRSRAAGYENLEGQAEVTIHMSEIMFAPKNIVISPGTTVTWINDDEAEHFVNTDSHPAHTYFPIQNSRGLTKGDSYSTTFDQPGAYPYHCSAHAHTMVGAIVVR